MKRLPRLADWPLIVKFGIAPALALGLLLVMAVIAVSTLREVAQATASRSILTISADPAYTEAGHCVVTITSTPKVQITVSKAAARAAHLRFNSGFLMLIREI